MTFVVLFEGVFPCWSYESWPTEECKRVVNPAATNVAVASAITVNCHLLLGLILLLIVVWVASDALSAAIMTIAVYCCYSCSCC